MDRDWKGYISWNSNVLWLYTQLRNPNSGWLNHVSCKKNMVEIELKVRFQFGARQASSLKVFLFCSAESDPLWQTAEIQTYSNYVIVNKILFFRRKYRWGRNTENTWTWYIDCGPQLITARFVVKPEGVSTLEGSIKTRGLTKPEGELNPQPPTNQALQLID